MLTKLIRSVIHENLNSYQYIVPLRLQHKMNKTIDEEIPPPSEDVMNFLNSSKQYKEIKEHLPRSLLRKTNSPDTLYLIDKNTGRTMAQTIKKHTNLNSSLIEVNPGLGILTKELLQYHKKLYLFETSVYFSKYLNQLIINHPEITSLKTADFFSISKLAFKDSFNGDKRIKELLGDLYTDNTDIVLPVVGSVTKFDILKTLVYDVYSNKPNHLGRPNYFLIMHPKIYKYLKLSRSRTAILFNLVFDCKKLEKFPKEHFLPWMPGKKTEKCESYNEDSLYLMNVKLKEEMPCQPDHLMLLQHFFHTIGPSHRVIPILEQWIPGCGVWLIADQDPPGTDRLLGPGKNDAQLPHMTVFTKFQDLNLAQRLTVFKRFISWPEFDQCHFKTHVENSLSKLALGTDEDKSVASIEEKEESDTEHDQ